MTRILLIAFIILDHFVFSQGTLKVMSYACKQEMTSDGKEIVLTNGKADIYINDTVLFKTVHPNDTGIILFNLPYNRLYKVAFHYPGYVTMSYLFSTENIPNNAPRSLSYVNMMFMKKGDQNVDYSLLNIPVIKYKYSSELKAITHDQEYLNAMSAALRTLSKLEAKTKIESEQKNTLLKQQTEQKLAEKELSKQKIVRNISLAGVSLLLAFLFFIFNSLQKNIRQKKVISEKHSEVEEQKRVIEEKQKDIIDSITYARRIQLSLLPTEKYIDKSISKLQDKKPSS